MYSNNNTTQYNATVSNGRKMTSAPDAHSGKEGGDAVVRDGVVDYKNDIQTILHKLQELQAGVALLVAQNSDQQSQLADIYAYIVPHTSSSSDSD